MKGKFIAIILTKENNSGASANYHNIAQVTINFTNTGAILASIDNFNCVVNSYVSSQARLDGKSYLFQTSYSIPKTALQSGDIRSDIYAYLHTLPEFENGVSDEE